MKSRGFNYFAFAKRPGDAIGTAVISTIEISRAVIHETLYRPILQVDINYEQSPISVLAIHAKSRIEGKEETAHLRLDTAQTLSDISEEILNENPTVLVIAAGDFNDTYEDKNMMSSESGNSPLRVSSKMNPLHQKKHMEIIGIAFGWIQKETSFPRGLTTGQRHQVGKVLTTFS